MRKTLSQSELGETFTTAEKVITQTEEELFCVITENKLAMFLSDEAAQEKGWEKRIVPGVMTFSIAIGLMETSGFLDDVIAFLGTDNLRFVKPAYIGDRLRVMVELKDKKFSKGGSRGTVHYEWRLVNQHGEDVVRAINTCMFKVGFFAEAAAS
jgi:acyl dehydratase